MARPTGRPLSPQPAAAPGPWAPGCMQVAWQQAQVCCLRPPVDMTAPPGETFRLTEVKGAPVYVGPIIGQQPKYPLKEWWPSAAATASSSSSSRQRSPNPHAQMSTAGQSIEAAAAAGSLLSWSKLNPDGRQDEAAARRAARAARFAPQNHADSVPSSSGGSASDRDKGRPSSQPRGDIYAEQIPNRDRQGTRKRQMVQPERESSSSRSRRRRGNSRHDGPRRRSNSRSPDRYSSWSRKERQPLGKPGHEQNRVEERTRSASDGGAAAAANGRHRLQHDEFWTDQRQPRQISRAKVLDEFWTDPGKPAAKTAATELIDASSTATGDAERKAPQHEVLQKYPSAPEVHMVESKPTVADARTTADAGVQTAMTRGSYLSHSWNDAYLVLEALMRSSQLVLSKGIALATPTGRPKFVWKVKLQRERFMLSLLGCAKKASKKDIMCASTEVKFDNEQGVDEGGLSAEMWGQMRVRLCPDHSSVESEAGLPLFENITSGVESCNFVPCQTANHDHMESLGRLFLKVVVESLFLPRSLAAYVLAYVASAQEGKAVDRAAIGTDGEPRSDADAESQVQAVLAVVAHLDCSLEQSMRRMLETSCAGFDTVDDLLGNDDEAALEDTRPGRARALCRHFHREYVGCLLVSQCSTEC
jgi:hypothetical protein